MALNNAQYEKIKREYDNDRLTSRMLLDKRTEYVNSHIPEYKALSDKLAELSLEYTKKSLSGDKTAISSFSKLAEDIRRQKEELLIIAGLDRDYLKPVYKCPDCKDTGFIDGRKCHCFKDKEIALLYDQSNIQTSLKDVSFDRMSEKYYSGDDLNRFKESKQKAIGFVNNFKSDYQNLLLYGTVGTGKSLLSSCVASELLKEGHSVIYFSSSMLIDTLAKAAFDRPSSRNDRFNDVSDENSPIYDCELLIIDDLGTEITNNFTIAALFSLLNERALRKKSIIISTNLSLEELQERYTDRIFSRLTGDFTFCRLSGPDIRIASKLAN